MPAWLEPERTWTALDSAITLSLLSSHQGSFTLDNMLDSLNPEQSQVSCHKIVQQSKNTMRQISYVKSDCDSGFVCLEFTRKSGGVMTLEFGQKTAMPGEACSELYFSPYVTKTIQLISSEKKTCALSGKYHLTKLSADTLGLLANCPAPAATSLELVAECGASSLSLEWACPGGRSLNLSRVRFSCNSSWSARGRTHMVLTREDSLSSSNSVARDRTHMVLTREDTSSSSVVRLCLTQTADVLSVSEDSCDGVQSLYTMTQVEPCLEALASPLSDTTTCRPSLLVILLLILAQRWMMS